MSFSNDINTLQSNNDKNFNKLKTKDNLNCE